MFTPGPSTHVMLQLLLDFDVDVAYFIFSVPEFKFEFSVCLAF